ncbi:GNAT family N-acetyltransferase [Winogradskyella vincentii]|uniref:GNAT family N-acetyltransferase n=1 Tax=Winogradskyella vincentii TaxID=2877122 RepID=A0ABS7XX42_9FLAO|nr:GNAT family N-acetyltransferase [Winogradskyella vincentii]MCA0151655.1 GNAT family N-acetyltransferase [Winogradskyella vincentii]
MEIRTLKGVSEKEITRVFNESFSDYFIPLQFTEEQLSSKLKADKTDLSLSVGSFVNGNLIAFILHGFDSINNENVVYNGGTGVVPKHRGLGLTKQMYQFILPILKGKGVNKLILEVIDENVQAIKSYEKSGFNITRHLACYNGEATISDINDCIEVSKLDHYDWKQLESFWDILPTWQNSTRVVNELKSTNISLGAYVNKQLVGYVIYNPTNNRIQQIAVKKDQRKKGVASTLVSELKKSYGNTFYAINVDKSHTVANQYFNTIGLKNILEQYEMELILS